MSGRRDISRRKFVALAGAGLAAVVSSAVAAAPATTKKKPASAGSKPAASPPAATAAKPAATAGGGTQKEFDRQKASTLAVVKKLRAYPLPPGGDLPVVFKPMRTPKKGH